MGPPQKAWQWDENRWFTAELDYECHGTLRFVDQKNGINSFVAYNNLPHIIFGSDDPDVVLGAVAGGFLRLVFSIDGGRNFLQEVRGLPGRETIKFVIARQGHIYVGLSLYGSNADGYFKWQQARVRREAKDDRRQEIEELQLVIIHAPLDKAKGRIGWYSVLAPTSYQFRSPYAEAEDVKRIDNFDSLGLPHVGGAVPSAACWTTLTPPLPPKK